MLRLVGMFLFFFFAIANFFSFPLKAQLTPEISPDQLALLEPKGEVWSDPVTIKLEEGTRVIQVPGGEPSKFEQPIWEVEIQIPEKTSKKFDELSELEKSKEWRVCLVIDPQSPLPVYCDANFSASGSADVPLLGLKYDYWQKYQSTLLASHDGAYYAQGVFRIKNRLKDSDIYLLLKTVSEIKSDGTATTTVQWAGPFESKKVAGAKKVLDKVFGDGG